MPAVIFLLAIIFSMTAHYLTRDAYINEEKAAVASQSLRLVESLDNITAEFLAYRRENMQTTWEEDCVLFICEYTRVVSEPDYTGDTSWQDSIIEPDVPASWTHTFTDSAGGLYLCITAPNPDPISLKSLVNAFDRLSPKTLIGTSCGTSTPMSKADLKAHPATGTLYITHYLLSVNGE